MLAPVTAFITDPAILAYLTVGGFLLTAFGLGVAIWQIRKVKQSADAAMQATKDVVREISLREQLMDLATAISAIEQFRSYADMRNREATKLVYNQLRGKIVALTTTDWRTERSLRASEIALDYLKNVQSEISNEHAGAPFTVEHNLSMLSDLLHKRMAALRLKIGDSDDLAG